MPRTAKSKPRLNSLPISLFYFIYCVFIYVLNQGNVSKFNHVQNFWDKKGRENGGDTGQEKYPSGVGLILPSANTQEWIHVYKSVSPFSVVHL